MSYRRRMISPDFFRDSRVKKLNFAERLFFIGIFDHCDDEGRIDADPAYLRSVIFPYDDLSLELIKAMRDRIVETNPNVQLYENAGEEYIHLRRWYRYQKPSHPQPSKLPPPPEFQEPITETIQEPITETIQEPIQEPFGGSQGQSSQGKYSIGQVMEDFTGCLDSENDLNDFLMTTLLQNISAGRAQVRAAEGGRHLSTEQEATVRMNWGISVLKKCWKDGIGEDMPNAIFDGARRALKQYPLEVVAKAFAKGVRYKGGKHKSWKYIQTIIDEEVEKRGHSPPHS